MSISWNVVNNTDENLGSAKGKIQSRISRLENALRRFPEKDVHLQIILDRKARRQGYVATLNLRIPSNVLHVSGTGRSLPAALDKAMRALEHRLDVDRSRRRKTLSRQSKSAKKRRSPARFSVKPSPEGASPQTREDVIRDVLEADYDRLVRFVNRQLHEYVVAGAVPKRAVDPRDVVDRVAEEVLSQPDVKPKSMDFPTWCSSLAYRHTREMVWAYQDESMKTVPVDMDVEPEHEDLVPDDLEPQELALNVLHDVMEPEEARLGDYIPDPKTRPPDVTTAEQDMVAALRVLARQWPRREREVFEMHYLEGLSSGDIALALQCDSRDVERSLKRIQNTLRRRLLQITDRVRR